jgi:hypothetical protein
MCVLVELRTLTGQTKVSLRVEKVDLLKAAGERNAAAGVTSPRA